MKNDQLEFQRIIRWIRHALSYLDWCLLSSTYISLLSCEEFCIHSISFTAMSLYKLSHENLMGAV